MTWLVAAVPHARANLPSALPARATLKSIALADSSLGKDLLLQIDGEYSFKATPTPEGTLYIDLLGVELGAVSPSAHWADGPLAGYQLVQFTDAGGESVLRVEVQTRAREPLIAERGSFGLRVRVGQSAPAPATPTPSGTGAEPSPGKPAEGGTFISDISVRPGSAGEVTIAVAMTRSATFHVYRFDHPERLVLDVEGARNAVRQNLIPVSSGVVKDVRVGQFQEKDPAVARVVADLVGNPVFDTHACPDGVCVEVKPRSMAAPQPVAPRPTPTLQAAAKHADLKPDSNRALPAPQASKNVAAVPQPAAPAPAPRIEASSKRADLNPVYNRALPASQSDNNVAAAPRQTPQAVTPEALRADKAAELLHLDNASGPSEAQGTAPAASPPTGEQKSPYTGELISLNLKDVDLKDFFRLIHEISGLNILVDPNVSGTVTTVLDNVPWDQALDIVLKNNGLGKVLEGNVLRIAKLETLTAEQETANKLAAARLEAAALVSAFRPVNYAKASAIATLLQRWTVGGALTKRGSVMVDERTNTLIISDVASQIPLIEGIITKLDTKTKQVAIEARIVLANSTFQRTLGAALVGTGSNTSGSTIGAVQTGTGSSITSSTTPPPTFTITPTANTGFGVVAITNFSQRYMIDAAITAAEIRSQAKTISRPSIITQTNTEGMVQQGTQIPVQTNINNTIAVQFVDATLQLTVTPQVTDDGHIFLKIRVQNASPGSIVTNAAVSINIQQATTQVLVPDGGTVVFGGVTVTQRQNSVTQIPVLGNIPILGNLFKSTTVQDSDQELLFFVSPRLLNS
jgi:type IV pilus assembly protein PilQ